MSFETPAAFWGLLSLGLLLLFSLWRQAAVRTAVPSLRLWKLIPERNPPLRALRRPRFRIELLIQALALATGVAALAGPYRASSEPVPRKVAFVFDTSARLLADDRLERLKAEARGRAARLRPRDELHVYASSPEPRRLGGIDEVQAVHEHVDPEPLLVAARAHAEDVIYFSDRAPVRTRALLLAGRAGNVGIVAFSADDAEVFARIVNHGPARRVAAEFRADAETQRFEIDLPAGERTWSRPGSLAGKAAVSLTLFPSDPLSLDDAAHAVRLAPGRATVSASGRHLPDLVRAIGAVPGAEYRWDPRATARDALVAVGIDAPPGKGAFRVWVDSPAEGFVPDRFTLKPHPLTAGMKEDQLTSARAAALPAGRGEPLIFANGAPVGVLEENGTLLRMNFEITPAGWPDTPSFPIFWTNVVDYARSSARSWAVVRSGEPFALPAGARKVHARTPGHRWGLSDEGLFLAHSIGEYEVETPEGARVLKPSLLDGRESDTAGMARALDWDPADPAGRSPERRPLAGTLAAVVLLLVVLAWHLERRAE